MQSSFSNTDSSLEIPDWFICICSFLLVDEKGIYYGKCIVILLALRNSDMTVLNRHGFKWKTIPAFFSALFFHGCVALGTCPHCTHQRVSRFGGYLLSMLHGIVSVSHLSPFQNELEYRSDRSICNLFFVLLDKTWHLNCKYIKKSCCFKNELKFCTTVPPSNDLQALSLLKETLFVLSSANCRPRCPHMF